MENIQPNDTNQYRCDGQRVANHAGDASHVNVVDQPAGETDKIQDPDDPGIVDTQSNGRDQLRHNHEDAERTVPGEKTQSNECNGENNLEYSVAFAFFIAVPINGVGKAAG